MYDKTRLSNCIRRYLIKRKRSEFKDLIPDEITTVQRELKTV